MYKIIIQIVLVITTNFIYLKNSTLSVYSNINISLIYSTEYFICHTFRRYIQYVIYPVDISDTDCSHLQQRITYT